MRAVRVARLDAVRLASSRRPALAVVSCLAVAWLASGDVHALAVNSGLVPGALDVHAAAVNNLMYIGYLGFTAFVLTVGDTVLSDRASGFGQLIVVRSGRPSWWLAKAFVVAAAALVMQMLLLAAATAIGAVWRGWELSSRPSGLASAGPAAGGSVLFPSVDQAADMWMRQLSVAFYLSLAFAALTLLLLVATFRARQRRLPFVLALLGLMADYVLVRAWEPWRIASPGVRLLEGAHTGIERTAALSWTTSVAYFSAMLVAACAIGVLWARYEDL
jgi:hypothetical protein